MARTVDDRNCDHFKNAMIFLYSQPDISVYSRKGISVGLKYAMYLVVCEENVHLKYLSTK